MDVYLVDTSVWIDFFRQHKTPAVKKLYQNQILERNINYGITEHIYQEVLQGALNETDFNSLADYMISQAFFTLNNILKRIDTPHRFILLVGVKV